MKSHQYHQDPNHDPNNNTVDTAERQFVKTIIYNNAAAMHMEHGEYCKAIKALTTAFNAFRKANQKMKRSNNSPATATVTVTMAAAGSEGFASASVSLSSSSSSVATEAAAVAASSTAQQQINTDELFFRSKTMRRRKSNASDDSSISVSSSASACEAASSSAAVVPDPLQKMDEGDDDDDDDDDILHDEVIMYSNPIHLPKEYPINPGSCGFLSTAITFNLAVAHHCYGLKLLETNKTVKNTTNISSSNKHLQNSGRLYEYTIRLERARAATVPSGQHYVTSPFVLMAVLNNLGHLHQLLDNATQSKKCFVHLQSTVMCLLQFKNKNINDRIRCNHELIQVFMDNSMIALQTVSKPTAAAA